MTSNNLHKVLPPNSTYVNAKLSKVKLKIVAYVWMKLDYWYMYFSSWEVASLELDEEWKCVHDKELSWQCLTGQVLSMKYINWVKHRTAHWHSAKFCKGVFNILQPWDKSCNLNSVIPPLPTTSTKAHSINTKLET
jgi:hypothetical protein